MPTLPRAPHARQDQAIADLHHQRATLYPRAPIPKVIPGGGVSLLAGSSGTGKTAFVAWLTTRFRDALPIFGYQPAPIPRQAILAIDRSWVQSTSEWFEAVGFPEIPHYAPLDDPDFDPAKFEHKRGRTAMLDGFLDRLDLVPHSLVYIDPIAPFLGGNLLDYDQCATACMRVRQLCTKRQITIIGTAHTAKLKGDKKDRYTREQDRIFGSTALLGYTDTQMYLAAPEESGTDFYTFLWNPHHAPKDRFDLTRDPNTGLFIPGERSAEDRPAITSTPAELLAFLATLLSLAPGLTTDAGMAYTDLLHLLDPMPVATLHRKLQQLIALGELMQPARGRYRVGKVQ